MYYSLLLLFIACCAQLDVNVALPSPDLLRRKIIVKNKKKSTQTGLALRQHCMSAHVAE